MSTAEDGSGHDKRPRPCCTRIVYFCCFMFTLILIFTIITSGMYLIGKPDPSFTVNNVKVYAFNLSSTSLTSSLQITFSFRRDTYDDGPGVHFDELDIYASYRNQQITEPTMIPPKYLGRNDVFFWSPYVNGTEVPLTPDLVMSLAKDHKTGTMPTDVKVAGRMRSKYGYVSGRYRLKANCRAYIMFWNNGSNIVGSNVNYPFDPELCGTHVGLLGLKIF